MNIGFEAKRVFHNKTGLGNYSRDLIRILSQYSSKNSYFLYNPKSSSANLFEPNEQNVFEKKPKTAFYTRFYNLWRQKGIINDLLADRITLFHGLSGEIPIGLKKNKITSVVTIHDLIFMHYPHLYSFFDRKIHYLKFKKAAKNADKIIAISEQTKEDIIRFLNVDSSKVTVIYQGCHAAFKTEYTNAEKDLVLKKYNLPENYILNVGTIEERKNAFTIVKAIKNIDTTLIIIGRETKYTTIIKKYLKDNNIENKVIFLTGLTTKELAITYQLASIFIYPSIFEGFGIPIIEALYSKTPVITNKFGVFPEAGGPDSIYIDPNDVAEMEKEIKSLLNDTQLRHTIADKGFKFVQKFNDPLLAKQVIATYENVLQD
ncbi:glycosyltransferase family 4 protein [Flavobacterium algicola]|uniref:glycosyltransferase family 4 protein n=1 Tax=Flavobacterium algicola TaxID=556529 RepID=UPI001EFD8110|nr:glycosyltransferase family 1 protein [Flavobacterium algicola]MCG9791094.1 glycosyltransferase family 4 protein [Flavobacterium algicola]